MMKRDVPVKTILYTLFIFISYSLLSISCGNSSKRGPQNRVSQVPQVTTITKANYNIFLENSGSMDGFVKKVSDFEASIYNFLVDIQNHNLSQHLNLYYINEKPIPWKTDVADFINQLEPATFKQRGGNRTSTDINHVLEMVLSKLNDSCVNVLISDCEFSLTKGQNARDYLVTQQIGVKRTFASKLDNVQFTTVVLQLNSMFTGKHFDMFNTPNQIECQRPYYIWVMGKQEHIVSLFDKIKLSAFKGGGVKNFYCLYNLSTPFNYMVLTSPKLGTYERDKQNPKTKIINAQKAERGVHSGKFQFSIGINLKNSLLDDSYILDTNNYTIPPHYQIEIIKSKVGEYTHILKLSTEKLKTETVSIALNKALPAWVDALNCDDNTNIKQHMEELDKTFGIKYLIEGVHEAYLSKNDEKKTIFEINISINQ